MSQRIQNLSDWASEFLDERLSKAAATIRKPELANELRSKINDMMSSLPGSAQREVDRFLAAARRRAATMAEMLQPDDSVNTGMINAGGVLMHRESSVPSVMGVLHPMMFHATNQHREAQTAVQRTFDGLAIKLVGKHVLAAQSVESAITAIAKADRNIDTLLVPRSQAIQLPSGISLPDLLRSTGRNVLEVGSVDGWSVDSIRNELQSDFSHCRLITADRIGQVTPGESVQASHLQDSELQRIMHVSMDAAPLALGHVLNSSLPTLRQRSEGVLLVTGGDGMLGGPSAGLIFGDSDPLHQISQSRDWGWLRADLTSTAALVVAMRTWANEPSPEGSIRAMLETTQANLNDRAVRMKNRLEQGGLQVSIRNNDVSAKLWNDAPWSLPTVELEVKQPPEAHESLSRRLDKARPRVLVKSQHDPVVIDLRWVAPALDSVLAKLIGGDVAGSELHDENSFADPNDSDLEQEAS